MLINPSLKLEWIRQHWPKTEQEWAFDVVNEEMFSRARDRYQSSQFTRTSGSATPTSSERAACAQAEGYLRLLEVGSRLTRALASSQVASSGSSDIDMPIATPESPQSAPRSQPFSNIPLDVMRTLEVKEELRRWEASPTYSVEQMGTIGLVEFWKAHALEFPLLYRIAMDVLPVQASSVSSERAFSLSRLTCTQERNKASAKNIEILQIVKHSLHRRRAGPQNNQTLNFVEHVIGPSESELETLDD